MMGDELLAQPSHPEITDQLSGAVLHPREEAGATVLIQEMTLKYGQDMQDQSIQALQAFFTFERGSLTMGDFLILFRLVFEEAETYGGLTNQQHWQVIFIVEQIWTIAQRSERFPTANQWRPE